MYSYAIYIKINGKPKKTPLAAASPRDPNDFETYIKERAKNGTLGYPKSTKIEVDRIVQLDETPAIPAGTPGAISEAVDGLKKR